MKAIPKIMVVYFDLRILNGALNSVRDDPSIDKLSATAPCKGC